MFCFIILLEEEDATEHCSVRGRASLPALLRNKLFPAYQYEAETLRISGLESTLAFLKDKIAEFIFLSFVNKCLAVVLILSTKTEAAKALLCGWWWFICLSIRALQMRWQPGNALPAIFCESVLVTVSFDILTSWEPATGSEERKQETTNVLFCFPMSNFNLSKCSWYKSDLLFPLTPCLPHGQRLTVTGQDLCDHGNRTSKSFGICWLPEPSRDLACVKKPLSKETISSTSMYPPFSINWLLN